MKRTKWFERKFDFGSEQNIFPSIIERLEGTPLRLEHKLRAMPTTWLTQRIDESWTIKENAGHLTDLEPLWQRRLEDIINGAVELSPTDLQNTQTTLAGHNETPLDELLASFRQTRERTIASLLKIDEETVFASALHPRLKTPMRTMDLFLFVAEHDDHHLARISELARMIGDATRPLA